MGMFEGDCGGALSQRLQSGLFDVSPSLSVFQPEDLCLGQSVIQADCGRSARIGTNSPNVISRDLGIPVFLASVMRQMAPTFAVHVARVIGWRSHPKMSRVTARRVIAGVANIHSSGYRSFSEFVSQSARYQLLVIVGENAVTGDFPRLKPMPAFIRTTNVYHLPKTLFNGLV